MTDTVLLLHGFTGSPASFDRLLEHLPTRRVVRPWLPGHGACPTCPWDDAITYLFAQLDGPTHVVGYSMGGRLAWGMLARRDPRIIRATLIGAHPGLSGEAAREARREADASWAAKLENEGLEAFVDAWERLPLWSSQAALPERLRAAQRRVRLAHRAVGLAGALRRLGLAEQPPMPRVEVPLALVVGELDLAHRALAAEAQRSLPHATLHVVEGAGHNVLFERPDAIAALLTEAA